MVRREHVRSNFSVTCRLQDALNALCRSLSSCFHLQTASDKKEAALDAMRASHAAVEGQLREAEALKAADARARRSAEKKVRSCLSLPPLFAW